MISKAIVFGRLTPNELQSSLAAKYRNTGAHAILDAGNAAMGIVHASGADGRSHAILILDGEMGGHEDIYAGDRTIVVGGPTRESEAVLRDLARVYGGYVRPARTDGWEPVARVA